MFDLKHIGIYYSHFTPRNLKSLLIFQFSYIDIGAYNSNKLYTIKCKT